MGLVGGADFLQLRAAAFHNFRNPEGSADLHQFSPGNDDLTALSQRRQHQKDSCRVVVHHQRTFCAGETAEDFLHMAVSAAALARFQIVFQIGIGTGCLKHGSGGFFGQAGAAQIGVQDDTGTVDDTAERREGVLLNPGTDSLAQSGLLRQGSCLRVQNVLPQIMQHAADGLCDSAVTILCNCFCQSRILKKIIHLGDFSQQLVHRNILQIIVTPILPDFIRKVKTALLSQKCGLMDYSAFISRV